MNIRNAIISIYADHSNEKNELICKDILIKRTLNNSDQRHLNEKLLNQHACAVWLTGLPSSGKTTIANAVIHVLRNDGFVVRGLDGDHIRKGLNKDLCFSILDRTENIRRIAEVSKLFIDCGVIVVCSFITPIEELRILAKGIIGKADFIEVFVNAPIEVCESRDIKGLYRKARKGEISGFTGIDSPFEKPINPDLELQTDKLNIEQSVQQLFDCIVTKIKY